MSPVLSFDTNLHHMSFFLVIALFTAVHWTAAKHQARHLVDVSIGDYLYGIRDKILSSNLHFQYDWAMNADFSRGLWSNYTTEQIPVFIVITELFTGQTGNILGNFLQYIACGQLAGAHLVIIDYNRQYDFHDPDLVREDHAVRRRPGENFFETIPAIIVNQHPAESQTAAIANYRNKCGGGRIFPWEGTMPIAEMIPYFRSLIQPGKQAHLSNPIPNYYQPNLT